LLLPEEPGKLSRSSRNLAQMDTLTHGLVGVAIAALPWPERLKSAADPRTALRASLLVGVLAAELPDLDYLLPATDDVLHTLRAHRGLTHALVFVPVIALVAAALVKLAFRAADFWALLARALITVPLAHLLPDLWTGWGTRLLLPFSEARLALDWTMVVDPWFTLPLLAAALWSARRRGDWQFAFRFALIVCAGYLSLRVGISRYLVEVVRQAYPHAETVHVFPAPLGVTRLRYVARLGPDYVAGVVSLAGASEQARVAALPDGPLQAPLLRVPSVREALQWSRFPVVALTRQTAGTRVQIADLRYHLQGRPTLTFVIDVTDQGTVAAAHLDRGGTAGDLLRQWWRAR
jgi:inner membrane protein